MDTTKLRELARHRANWCSLTEWDKRYLTEAADTIERLQKELAQERSKVRVLRKAKGLSISKGALA